MFFTHQQTPAAPAGPDLLSDFLLTWSSMSPVPEEAMLQRPLRSAPQVSFSRSCVATESSQDRRNKSGCEDVTFACSSGFQNLLPGLVSPLQLRGENGGKCPC